MQRWAGGSWQPLSLGDAKSQPGVRCSHQTLPQAHGGSRQLWPWGLTDCTHLPAFPHVPAPSITLVCSLAHTHSPKHTHPAARRHAGTHHLSIHRRAHTCTLRLGLLPHTSSMQLAHGNGDMLSSASLRLTGVLWVSQPGANAHAGSAVDPPHTRKHSAWGSGTHAHREAQCGSQGDRGGDRLRCGSHTQPAQPWSPDLLRPAPAHLGLPLPVHKHPWGVMGHAPPGGC